MTRHTPFDEHVARGLLKVIGQAGHLLGKEAAPGRADTQDAAQAARDSRSEGDARHVPEAEPAGASVDAAEGDLAAQRLLALVDRAAEASEPPPPLARPSCESPLVSAHRTGEPLLPMRSAAPHGKRDGVPQPNPWCLALTEAEEPKRRLIEWLEAHLPPASAETD